MPSLYIVLEREISNVDIHVNGNFLSKYNEDLASIAKRAHLAPLMNFFSASKGELVGFAEGHGVSPSQMKVPDERWFEADEGLRTLNALLQNPETAQLPHSDRIASELREFVALLEVARASGVRWHLGVDY